MPRSSKSTAREKLLPLGLILGDTVATFGALALGFWLRYRSRVGHLGLDVPDATFRRYLPLLLAGVALLVAAFAQFGLYDARLMLRRYASLNAILKGAGFWLLAYLGVSLVLEFDPPISRLFVVIAFVLVVVLLFAWRSILYAALASTQLGQSLRRRTAILGVTPEARDIAAAIASDRLHPLKLAGYVTLQGEDAAPGLAGTARLGDIAQLDTLLAEHEIELLIATSLEMSREQLRRTVESCERAYVEWKVVPAAFDIFLSSLRLQTIGKVPILGVEELAISRLFSRALKRGMDIAGATVGCLVSLPVVAVIAVLIKRESPGGPVFFRQERIGVGHRRFILYKLRSMRPEAGASDHEHQSTSSGDPRLLKIGRFIRRWNLDELPQFWNVLQGEMSLVGPRPERPYHVTQLAEAIPHYLPRHLVKPGMTGWAQINGLRGASDLAARIQHDIYYIENWSVWLDVQILLLTFARWRDPS